MKEQSNPPFLDKKVVDFSLYMVNQVKEIKNETIKPKEIKNAKKEIYEYNILFVGEANIGQV